jgi:hypothetical protein
MRFYYNQQKERHRALFLFQEKDCKDSRDVKDTRVNRWKQDS